MPTSAPPTATSTPTQSWVGHSCEDGTTDFSGTLYLDTMGWQT
jgi:hypothetical protein